MGTPFARVGNEPAARRTRGHEPLAQRVRRLLSLVSWFLTLPEALDDLLSPSS
ncbi:MAG: hypothetical protein HC911_17185 [Chloroflexaceae bacterium]|nr:hypothetical protein [Chloroflexaceae bacterium]